MQYTNKYMCKLNFYKCWNICVDHCQLVAMVYKVKIEKKTRIGSKINGALLKRLPNNFYKELEFQIYYLFVHYKKSLVCPLLENSL